MAHILIVTHTFDGFGSRPFLLRELIRLWSNTRMHRFTVVEGPHHWPDADVAVLHVDQSLVPDVYAQAARRYPVVINGAALDIRKKLVSTHQLRASDAWNRPVIVKTDLNRGGEPEMRYIKLMRQAGLPVSPALDGMAYSTAPYPILPSMAQVTPAMWANPGLVVERFLPERDARGYWMRVWVFLGRQERCSRFLSQDALVKGGNILARETVPVPEALRAHRKRLGFDYGKFDFVVHEGTPVLLDANRTPTAPPASVMPELEAENAQLARGFDDWVAS